MITIRRAEPADIPEILAMVRELAAYEDAPLAVFATEQDLHDQSFREPPSCYTFIAEWDGQPVGFALYCFGFSTWRGARTLYLEDLFVREPFRKRRIGLALMQRLAREAVSLGCPRFVWQVLEGLAPSIRFYESLGATVMREWLTVRLEGDALRRLAEGR